MNAKAKVVRLSKEQMEERKRLEGMNLKDLRKMAKDIPGRYNMDKETIIAAIEARRVAEHTEKKTEASVQTAETAKKPEGTMMSKTAENLEKVLTMEEVKEKATATAVPAEEVKQAEASIDAELEQAPVVTPDKLKYLENISVGTIVAFKISVGGVEKVKSAAVEKVSQKRQKLCLHNKVGVEFIVDFTDVVWVRTGKFWPRGVFELLKESNK